jgi:hypothetical protein
MRIVTLDGQDYFVSMARPDAEHGYKTMFELVDKSGKFFLRETLPEDAIKEVFPSVVDELPEINLELVRARREIRRQLLAQSKPKRGVGGRSSAEKASSILKGKAMSEDDALKVLKALGLG